MDRDRKRISKFMSLVLRHRPTDFGVELDAHGWARIEDLIAAAQQQGHALDRELLEQVVRENDKQRFAIHESGLWIRARQGHSVKVDLELVAIEPPPELFHGTANEAVPSIRRQGLLKRSRHHVHLSPDAETARKVGSRHGSPVVLTVASGAMHREGISFFRSENGVWLVESVPVRFLRFPEIP